MKQKNLELAKTEIDEALSTVENMELYIKNSQFSNDVIKEKFVFLSQKVQELENILKEEGIID